MTDLHRKEEQLPAEKKLPLTPEEKKMLLRRDLTLEEKDLLLSRDLTKKEREDLLRPPSSLTPRNKDRRKKMVFEALYPNVDLSTIDPATLPPVYDYQFVNKSGIEMCVPGTDEFIAQRILNKFLSEPEVVAVESSDGPLAGDPNAPPPDPPATRSTANAKSGEKPQTLTEREKV